MIERLIVLHETTIISALIGATCVLSGAIGTLWRWVDKEHKSVRESLTKCTEHREDCEKELKGIWRIMAKKHNTTTDALKSQADEMDSDEN